MASTPHDAVLPLAFGGPTGRDEIRPHLDNVLRGRPISTERYEEVVSHRGVFDDISSRERYYSVVDAARVARRRGAGDVVIAPIGFVSDHVKVLYDLDVHARGVAMELGLGYSRAATVGDHPSFLRMLAAVVRGARSSSS